MRQLSSLRIITNRIRIKNTRCSLLMWSTPSIKGWRFLRRRLIIERINSRSIDLLYHNSLRWVSPLFRKAIICSADLLRTRGWISRRLRGYKRLFYSNSWMIVIWRRIWGIIDLPSKAYNWSKYSSNQIYPNLTRWCGLTTHLSKPSGPRQLNPTNITTDSRVKTRASTTPNT
jgi:hypothetical protein